MAEPYSFTFKNIAMDHFGTITLKDGKKAYSLLITIKTRATEIYLTEDKGEQGVLLALKRFITRWDFPHKIITNTNATFKATSRIIESSLRTAINPLEFEWKFIDPYCPFKGGIYERLIGLAKKEMEQIQPYTLTTIEYQVIMDTIRQALNQRPLTKWEDENGPMIITPQHFMRIIGTSRTLTETFTDKTLQQQVKTLNDAMNKHVQTELYK